MFYKSKIGYQLEHIDNPIHFENLSDSNHYKSPKQFEQVNSTLSNYRQEPLSKKFGKSSLTINFFVHNRLKLMA
jgi:hypothetical protein